MMQVTALLFASYAEHLGRDAVSLELPDGATVDDVLRHLAALPGGDRLPPEPLVAVNLEYAARGHALAPGDEVAVIPPIAGG
ncbi:MAG TPA: MoaD/ThiS family protein [Gemmatimonadaceae bacterium]|nr:MoaD/ThiS family protein [Gemmatimonadaceae bacterium]